MPVKRQYPKSMGFCAIEYTICLDQQPVFGTLSSIASIHGPKNRGVNEGVASLSITSHNLLAKFFPPIPAIGICTGLK